MAIAPDVVKTLERVLPALARLVQSETRAADDQLVLLLTGVDLSTDPAAFAELRVWADVLERVRRNPRPATREIAADTLMLRGVAEAPTLLALALIDRDPSSSANPSPPNVVASVDQIAFGVIAPGQGARTQFEVRGGPGLVVCNSDQLTVTPQAFRSGSTSIVVEVAPQTCGVLWTHITLISTTETTSLRVSGQWSDKKEHTGPILVVAPDGSGTHRTVPECLEAAEPGTTIYLQPGTHYLEQTARVNTAVTLAGADRETTELIGAPGMNLVLVEGGGRFGLQNLALRWTGDHAGDLVRITSGQVAISNCQFHGRAGVAGDEHGRGLWLGGEVVGTVQDCDLTGNVVAIEVAQEAHPVLTGNTCRGNDIGIRFVNGAQGEATKNECATNATAGIWVGEKAAPLLVRNTCRDNGWGIVHADRSSGISRHNRLIQNRLAGIHVAGAATPEIAANACAANSWGIVSVESSTPTVHANECVENRLAGIQVLGAARVIVEDNRCERNGAGIVFAGTGTAIGQRNQCVRNETAGIMVAAEAGPDLEANICAENGTGILFSGTASGSSRRNQCFGNRFSGIDVTGDSIPELVENECRSNHWGISYSGQEGGTARGNLCEENRARAILVSPSARPHGVLDA